MQHTYPFHGNGGPIPADGADPSLMMVLIFVALLVAIIWLIGWQPAKAEAPKSDEKPLRKEIEEIFESLRNNAATFNRPEFLPSLALAQAKVADALEKRKLLGT